MDGRAVVALVVVLHHELPVGGHLVLVLRRHQQPGHSVRVQPVGQAVQVLADRGRGAVGVDEDEALPLGDPHLDQAHPVGVQGVPVRAGHLVQPAAQVVHPVVVLAGDEPAGRRAAAGEQLVPAVPARVVEAAQHAVVVTDQQHGVAGAGAPAAAHERHRPAGPGCGDVRAAPDARPAAVEDDPALPVEHRLVGVRGPRQHRAGALQAGAYPLGVQRGRARAPAVSGVRGLGRGRARGPTPDRVRGHDRLRMRWSRRTRRLHR
jgi:hypothetical protein